MSLLPLKPLLGAVYDLLEVKMRHYTQREQVTETTRETYSITSFTPGKSDDANHRLERTRDSHL